MKALGGLRDLAGGREGELGGVGGGGRGGGGGILPYTWPHPPPQSECGLGKEADSQEADSRMLFGNFSSGYGLPVAGAEQVSNHGNNSNDHSNNHSNSHSNNNRKIVKVKTYSIMAIVIHFDCSFSGSGQTLLDQLDLISTSKIAIVAKISVRNPSGHNHHNPPRPEA